MKEDSGKKIQTLANAVRIVMIVLSAILAIVQGFSVGIATGRSVNGFVAVLAVFVVATIIFGFGYFLAWVTTCLLRGFGEIVENTAETASYLKMLVEQSEQKSE